MYLAIAWGLIVCYSILLLSAAESIIDLLIAQPEDHLKQIVTFLYGFAVVSFLGGAQVPAVFLKKKSFTLQFVFATTFGFFLLLITILNETILNTINELTIKPLFMEYPIIALEYLAIPYLSMIFLDMYLSGRLEAFSWRELATFIRGVLLRPIRTFEEIIYCNSITFSLVVVISVSMVFIARTTLFSLLEFTPSRWSVFPFQAWFALGLVMKVALMVPILLLLWIGTAGLAYVVAQRLDGISSYSDLASLSGFALLPTSTLIFFDFLEYSLQAGNIFLPKAVFLTLGFLVPLVSWPLILAVLAIKVSEGISYKAAAFTGTMTFLPFFLLFARTFL